MIESYKQLVNRLNEFRKKYYLIKLLRGIILFFSLLVVYLFGTLIIESFFYLLPEYKIIIIYFSLSIIAGFIAVYLVYPLLKYFGITGKETMKQLEKQLKKFLPEIKDTLLNTIELAENNEQLYPIELINASIEQKYQKLKVFDFQSAISFSTVKKILLKFLLIISIAILLFVLFKTEISNAAFRIAKYQTEFVKPAPFDFVLLNKELKVRKGSDLKIELQIKGRQKPETVYLSFGGNNFLMNHEKDLFTYEIENINNSFSIVFSANNYNSKRYKIEVLQIPIIKRFEVEILPPKYTGIKNENIKNIGDLIVPHGTNCKWIFETNACDQLLFIVNDTIEIIAEKEKGIFTIERQLLNNMKYAISLKNENFEEENVLNYKAEIVKDLYPEIEVVQMKDSTEFLGIISKEKLVMIMVLIV